MKIEITEEDLIKIRKQATREAYLLIPNLITKKHKNKKKYNRKRKDDIE
jgi:hypothetical protein